MPGRHEQYDAVYGELEAELVTVCRGAVLRPAPFAGDGQFQHTRSIELSARQDRTLGSRASPRLQPADREASADPARLAVVLVESRGWHSAARSGWSETTQLAVRYTTPQDQKRWEDLGAPSLLPPSPRGIAPTGEDTLRVGNISLSRAELMEFPTDPQMICQRLLATRPDDPPKLLSQLVESLRSGPKPEALRAALYQALLLQPTVRAAGNLTDGAGREGMGLRYVREDQDKRAEQELIFDPASLELLGARTRSLPPISAWLGVPPGTVTHTAVILEHAVTDEVELARP